MEKEYWQETHLSKACVWQRGRCGPPEFAACVACVPHGLLGLFPCRVLPESRAIAPLATRVVAPKCPFPPSCPPGASAPRQPPPASPALPCCPLRSP